MELVSAKIDRETLHAIATIGEHLRLQTGIPHPNYVVIRMGIALLHKKLLRSQKRRGRDGI